MNIKTKLTMIFAVFAVLALIPGVLAQISIVENTVSLTSNPGNLVQGAFQVHNDGNQTTVGFSNYSMIFNSRTINITPITNWIIPANSTQTVTFTASVPTNQLAGTYSTSLVAAETINASNKDTVQINLAVNSQPNLAMIQNTLNIVQNQSGTLNLTFQNTGNNDLSVSYSLINLTQGSNYINVNKANSFIVLYGSSFTDTALISAGSVPTGTYTGTVYSVYNGVPKNFTVNVNVQQAVTGFTATSAVYYAMTNAATQTKNITISNTGNMPLTNIQLTPSSVSAGNYSVTPTLSQSVISLAPGESKQISVTLTFSGQPAGTYTGTITSSVGSLTSVTQLQATVRTPVALLAIPGTVQFPEADYNETVRTTFLMQNTGDYDLFGVQLTTNAPSSWNVTFANVPTTLLVGQNATINVTAKVPDEQTSGTYSIGTITATSDKANATSDLRASVKGKLDIQEVRIKVDGYSWDTLVDGETASRKPQPNGTVKVEIKVRNLYSSSWDADINDIVVTTTLRDIDDGDDIEEESSSFDLNSGEDETVSTTFDIPTEVEAKKYTIDIFVEGDDDRTGRLQTDRWTVYVTVEKETHRLLIEKASIGQSILSCGDSTFLDVSVLNIGRNDEDDARLTIINQALGLNSDFRFEVTSDTYDDDSKFQKNVAITVPDNFASGTYPIYIKAYWDTTSLTDEETVQLTVTCDQGDITPVPPTPVNPPVTPTDDNITLPIYDGTPTTLPPQSVESSFAGSKAYVALLIILNVVVIIILIVLVAKLISKD